MALIEQNRKEEMGLYWNKVLVYYWNSVDIICTRFYGKLLIEIHKKTTKETNQKVK